MTEEADEVLGLADTAAEAPAIAFAPAVDLPKCLSHIIIASRALEANSARVSELEAQVQELTEQHAAMAEQLVEADRRLAELQIALGIEQSHTSRAEALAKAAATRANELEASAFEAAENLETLTQAIWTSFAELPEELADIQVAA
jgi:chromosome segregation ATPase